MESSRERYARRKLSEVGLTDGRKVGRKEGRNEGRKEGRKKGR